MYIILGGGPSVVVSTAAFHARVRGSVPGLGGFKETKMFLPHPRVKVSIVGSLRDREVACSASDRQGSNFESCVWRTVSSQSSHHPQEVLLAQFSLYVHEGGLKPDSFHFICISSTSNFHCFHSNHDIKTIDRLSAQNRVFTSRPPLCTCRLNWARIPSWGWWDAWDDTALQTQASKFGSWRSEHATSPSGRFSTKLNLYEWAGKKHFVSFWNLNARLGLEPAITNFPSRYT